MGKKTQLYWHLDQLMRDRNLTNVAVADALGYSPEHICYLKKTKPVSLKLAAIEGLCDLLQCEPEDLLNRKRNGRH